jgi:hypothetical protein
MEKTQQELENASTCKHKGPLTEYVGSKIAKECNSDCLGQVNFMWLVLVRKLIGEYKPTDGPASKIQAFARQVLFKCDSDDIVSMAQAKMYWSVTVTCMYMMQWYHLDIFMHWQFPVPAILLEDMMSAEPWHMQEPTKNFFLSRSSEFP